MKIKFSFVCYILLDNKYIDRICITILISSFYLLRQTKVFLGFVTINSLDYKFRKEIL